MTAEEILAAAGGQAPPELFLVVGADLVPELGSWERPRTSSVWSPWPSCPGRLRPQAGRSPWLAGLNGSTVPQVPVSSSEVRDLLARAGRSRALVPPPSSVAFRRRNLYAVLADERHAGRVDGAVGKPPCPERLPTRVPAPGGPPGRAEGGAPLPPALGRRSAGHPRRAPSGSPSGSWTCSIEPRVDVHVQLPPAAATPPSRRTPSSGGHGGAGHDRALRRGRRLRHHERAEQPPRADAGRGDRARRQGGAPASRPCASRACRTRPGS
jgi:hypothetical protein